MITAPFSPSASPTTSWNCSMALPIQAKTSETSSFLSAINPSSDIERPNMTFPMMFSFPLVLFSWFVVENNQLSFTQLQHLPGSDNHPQAVEEDDQSAS